MEAVETVVDAVTPRDLLDAATPRPWLLDPTDEGSLLPADAALATAAVNEYEALLDVAEAAEAFWQGNTHDSPASDPLCFALARLSAVRTETKP